MKKERTPFGDFFSRYKREKLQKAGMYMLSGVFSVLLAFSFVSYSKSGNLGELMANVGNLTQSAQYDADLILKKSENSIKIIFGSHAEKVDSIKLTVLSSPDHVSGIATQDPNVSIVPLGEGRYQIVQNTHGKNITAGTVLMELQANIKGNTLISLVNTEFINEGVSYSLTNKSE